MLAFQLATGAGLLLSAQNLVSGIDIGEAIRKSEVSYDLLRHLLRRSLVLGGLGLGGVAAFSYLLEHHFLTEYAGLFQATVMLSVGLIAYLAASNLTELAFYRGAHRLLVIGLFALLVAGVSYNLFNLSAFRGTVSSLSTFTGGALLIYACVTILYTQRLAYPLNRKAQEGLHHEFR